jgi:hypothetical protein
LERKKKEEASGKKEGFAGLDTDLSKLTWQQILWKLFWIFLIFAGFLITFEYKFKKYFSRVFKYGK